MSDEILSAVLIAILHQKQIYHKPVFLKLPADVPIDKLDEIISFAWRHHIDGFIATGPTQDRSLLIHSAETEIKQAGAGGISGLPVIHKSIEVVRYLSQTHCRSMQSINPPFSKGQLFPKLSFRDSYSYIRLFWLSPAPVPLYLLFVALNL